MGLVRVKQVSVQRSCKLRAQIAIVGVGALIRGSAGVSLLTAWRRENGAGGLQGWRLLTRILTMTGARLDISVSDVLKKIPGRT